MCLALPGRQYPARKVTEYGQQLHTGFDSHISNDTLDGQPGDQMVIFHPSQLLPCFIVKSEEAGPISAHLKNLIIPQILVAIQGVPW